MAKIFKKTDERYQSTDAKLLWIVSRINAKKTKTRAPPGHCILPFLWTFLSLDAFRKVLWSNGQPVVITDLSVMEFTFLPSGLPWFHVITWLHLLKLQPTARGGGMRFTDVTTSFTSPHSPPSPPGCMSSHKFYNFRHGAYSGDVWPVLKTCTEAPFISR